MSKKNSNSFGGFVFSTDPGFQNHEEPEAEDMNLTNDKQNLRIWLERGKGGKESTVIKGYIGPPARLEELAKLLKNKCAAGGNAKDGIVIIQGDHREKVLKMLVEMGYKNTKKAGG